MIKLFLSSIFIIFVILLNTNYQKKYDNILFVQVWPPSWLNNTKYNYTNDYFTIHGIWPNNLNGSYPSYCNKSIQFDFNKIEYLSKNLSKYWTNFRDFKLFLEHEFDKHMTCLDTNNIYKYFEMTLIKRNSLDFFNKLKNNDIIPTNKYKYDTENIRKVIRKEIGYNPIITCNKDVLNEIIVCTDNDLNLSECSIEERKMDCRNQFIYYNYY